MSNTSRITIIDCGASHTALGVFSLKNDRLVCSDFTTENFKPRAAGEDDWLINTKAALGRFGAKAGRAGPVVLIFPGHLTLTKLIRAPRVDLVKREKIVRFEASQYIPHPLAEVVWGSIDSGQGENEQEVLLVAAKRDIVEQLCNATLAAGFIPRRILPVAITTLEGFRQLEPASSEPALLLNLGARSSTLLLIEQARFAARSIPLGGNTVTQQIAENQNCNAAEAEKIKCSNHNIGLLTDAREAIAGRLAQEITRSVMHFRRDYEFGNPTQVGLVGGGSRLAGLGETLAGKLKLPLMQVDGRELLVFESGASGDVPLEIIGAAALELRQLQPALNLLPVKYGQRESLRRRQPWLLATALLLVMVLIPPILHYRQLTTAAQEKAIQVEQEIGPLLAREARMQRARENLAGLRAQITELQAVQMRRTGWLELLAALQESLVKMEDVWLERLETIPPAGDVPMKLAVSGRMLDKTNPLAKVSPETYFRVNNLLKSAGGLPHVSGIEGERLDNSQPGILKFDFVLIIDPSHPL